MLKKYDFEEILKDSKNTYRFLNPDSMCSDKHYLKVCEMSPKQIKLYIVDNCNCLKDMVVITPPMFHHWRGKQYSVLDKPLRFVLG
jgi:hypothetical protein